MVSRYFFVRKLLTNVVNGVILEVVKALALLLIIVCRRDKQLHQALKRANKHLPVKVGKTQKKGQRKKKKSAKTATKEDKKKK